jgi:hypothetical protein
VFRNMKRFFPAILFCLGALLPASAFALSPEAARLVGQKVKGTPMTINEVAAMPPPCLAIGMGEFNGVFWAEAMKKNGTIATLDRPENVMAKGAGWFHHYCWGLLDKHRAFASVEASKRAFLIKTWRSEMQFVVDRTAQEKINWAYLPVMYAEIAESYIQEKDYPNAIGAANKAVELNPELTRGYMLLADIFEQVKDRKKALAAVTEGLKRAPTAKGLQRRYKEFGGSMPFPEPYKKPVESETSANAAPPVEDTTSDRLKEDSTPNTSPNAPDEPEKIGVPGNPYCRFCPP